jgi:hypothetical protein
VLVVGRNPAAMARVLEFLRASGYEAVGALAVDEAERLMQTVPDALVIGGDVPLDPRTRLIAVFGHRYPGRPVVEHVGGPAGLLDHLARALPR